MRIEALWKLFALLCEIIRWFTKLIPKSGTLLIVEDNQLDAQILSYRLKKLGWKSEIATNGEVAQGLVTHTFYPVAFVDLRLPGMSGTALLRLLSQNTPNTNLVVICGEPADLHDLPDGQAVMVMRKPPTLEALEDILKKIRI